MKRKLLLAIALGVVATCAAAFGVGCNKPNNADNTPEKPEHNFGEWVIDREATCLEVGRKYHVCTDEGCNVMEWEVIPKMAHKNDIINRTNAGHSFTCSVCSTTTEIETHNFENGICTGCSCYEGDNFDFAFRLSGDESYYVIENFSDKNATDIVIPSTYNGKPVKAIGIETFKNFTSLKNITIPDSVTSIGDYAFYGCSALTSINIPDSVTSIGNKAFYGCSALTSINIPDSVTSIGNKAFRGCSALTSITVGENNTVYKSENNCILTKDGKTLTLGCKNSIISDGVTSISNYAFEGCSGLTSITIPDSVTSIGDGAFYGCSGLIQKENGVSYVDKWVIDCDSLVTEVTLRSDTMGIADRAFNDCSGLKSVTVDENNQNYKSVNNCILTKDGKTLVVGCKNSIIPNSVTSIGDWAFGGCSGLTSITIPDSVTSIGDGAFSGCSGLTSITIPDSVTSIGDGAFGGCSGLTSITIPDSVTSIGDGAFWGCSGLTSATFENTTGWQAQLVAGYNILVNFLTTEELSDTKLAAQYLTDTYCRFDWTNTKNSETNN